MYNLEYLPAARQDMIDIARYISHDLSNPEAAGKLSEELVAAAGKLADFPYMNRVYNPVKPLEQEYRRLPVRNYLIFYYVDEKKKVVTIARVIYARRDYERLLKQP